jgi:hypothetical protein
VFLAAHLLAARLAQVAAFFWSCPVHARTILAQGYGMQDGNAGDLHCLLEVRCADCKV